jgi:ribosomal protein L37AE/L43A
MAQHFLLSSKARTLSLASVARIGEEEAVSVFQQIRWSDNGGEPYCPKCGCTQVYRRATNAMWDCKACKHAFTVTSGTIFASHKRPLRDYLLAIAIFCNGAKGHSALQLSRDLDCQYKTAFVLAHKLREAMATEDINATASGEVEIDGAYFGGYVKPANWKENCRDRRLARNQTDKRRVVIVVRERQGKTLTFVTRTEDASVPRIREIVLPGSIVHADEASHWDRLGAKFLTRRINHSQV